MNRIIQFFKKQNNGYLSIEVVVVCGLVVGLSAFVINGLGQSSTTIMDSSSSTIENSMANRKIQ